MSDDVKPDTTGTNQAGSHDALAGSARTQSSSGAVHSAGGLGKYRLLAELGKGGMADVYLAVAAGPGGFNKLLVIKQLRVSDDPHLVTMFLDEAKLAARVNHANVVQTFEVVHEAQRAFMVMEFLDGPSLSRLRRAAAKRYERVPLGIELRIMRDALAGLHHAHELKSYDGTPLNVVHRDFTPQNLIVTYAGAAKIVDFGIAKALDQQAHTSAGMFKGKLTYVPPEQLMGQPIDRRADIFAAGVMIYEAVTGDSPWKGLTNAAVTHALAQGNIPRLLEQRDAPAELAAICDQAMAVDPDARYATAEELKAALDEFVADQHLEVDSKEVGEYVSRMLADARERTRRVIEQQMRSATTLPSGDTLTQGLPTLDGLTPSPPQKLLGRDLPALMASTAMPDTGARPLTDPLPEVTLSTATKAMLGIGVSVLVVLVGLVGWLALRPPAVVPTVITTPAVAPVAPPPVEPPASSDSATEKDRPATVSVRLRVSPANARLFLDDVELPSNPFSGSLKRDGVLHQLRVSAPGYVEVRRGVQFDRDLDFEVALTRQTAAPAVTRDKRSASTTVEPKTETKAEPKQPDPNDADYFPAATPQKKPPKRPLDTTIEF